MTIPDIAAIIHLDFLDYGCQCPAHPNHQPCPNTAVYTVTLHNVGNCNEPGLTFGNRVELRCPDCTHKLQTDIQCRLAALNAATNHRLQCDGCGAPMTELRDILRGIERL
jgi:hypothetical protein